MRTYYPLKVLQIETLTPYAKSITFGVPYLLKEKFKFTAGQYITLKYLDEDGTKHYRCYSISSIPSGSRITIGVKKVKGGLVSPYLVDQLKVNETIEVEEPSGNFSLRPDNPSNFFVFIVGGSGITPIKSMIGHLLHNNLSAKVLLIYSNRDNQNIMYEAYFESLAQTNTQFQLIHCLSKAPENWNGFSGHLTVEKSIEIFNTLSDSFTKADFYICGPGILMKNTQNALQQYGISEEQVFLEYFAPINSTTLTSTSVPSSINSQIKVVKNGKTFEFEVVAQESILAGALRQNIPLDYSCQAGLCSSCCLKLEEGNVVMHNSQGLTKAQRNDGFILTCQAFCTTSNIVLQDEMPVELVAQRKSNRWVAIVIGMLLSVFSIGVLSMTNNQYLLALGEMNTGHEHLSCEDCHTKAKGTLVQQLNANFKFLIGQRQKLVDFGLQNVNNKKCQNCHERPNDRHPVHRFLEPRFSEARQNIHPEKCESCHLEHQGARVVLQKLDFCQECHQETELKQDPLDISHAQLIKENQWQTCLQCHDFHGNHLMKVPTQMKDTIPRTQLINYSKGGNDPFGEEKKYLSNEEKKAIQELLQKTSSNMN